MSELIQPIARPKLAPIIRGLSGLMQHQGWLWGKDVRCSEGNRLILYGFERMPAPIEIKGGTTLYRRVEPGRTILLWSWGVTIHRPEWPEAIHVSRGGGGVYAISQADVAAPCWCYDDAKRCWRELDPAMSRLVPDALRWPAEYERWVQRSIGVAHREAELREWHKGRSPAAGLPDAWDAIARQWSDALDGEASAAMDPEVMRRSIV